MEIQSFNEHYKNPHVLPLAAVISKDDFKFNSDGSLNVTITVKTFFGDVFEKYDILFDDRDDLDKDYAELCRDIAKIDQQEESFSDKRISIVDYLVKTGFDRVF